MADINNPMEDILSGKDKWSELSRNVHKNCADNEDIGQEVLVAILEKLEEPKLKKAPGPYVGRIIKNKKIDSYRNAEREERFSVGIPSENPLYYDDPPFGWKMVEQKISSPEETTDVEGSAILQQYTSLVFEIYERAGGVKKKWIAATIMHDYEGHRIREIATKLNVTEGAVKKYLHLGRRLLRSQLQKRGCENPFSR